jgi:integrase
VVTGRRATDAALPRRPCGCASAIRAAPTPTRARVEMAREGVSLNVIQRQLGHANLGITSVYLQGIDNSEIIETVGARAAPTLPASAGLR